MSQIADRRGLGRGLGELFQRTELRPPVPVTDQPIPGQPTSDQSVPGQSVPGQPAPGQPAPGSAPGLAGAGAAPITGGAYFAELPIEAIVPNPRQPRTVFDPDDLAELVESVLEVGLLQPVVVRPSEPAGFELVMGERRWRAAQQAGMKAIPAIVRRTEDHHLLRDALLENLHRAQLNPLEEAAAYQQMLSDFGCTHDELASRIKRSRPQISNTLRLLRLPPTVQRRVAAGVISAGHARALLALDEPAAQERLAQRVVAEGLSVRTVEELVTVGEQPGRPRPRARSTASDAGADELAARLADHLDTRVRVDQGRRRGRITIEFATPEDRDRLAAILLDGDRTDGPAGEHSEPAQQPGQPEQEQYPGQPEPAQQPGPAHAW